MNKRRKVTVIVVLVMLCLAAGAWLLLFDRQFRELNPNGKNAQETITEIIEIIKGPESEITGSAAEILSEWQIADRVYSHRGSAGTDEHSFEAYDAAIEAGSHNIEQDIVISSEGTLYVSHDLSAYAMTGVDRQFSDMTDAEIDGLTRYSGGKVLRLSEVFERYGSKVHYIIELKSSDDATIEAFKNEVDEHDVEGLVIVQALENEVLRSLDSIYPDMPKLQVVKTESALWQAMESDVVDIVGARVQFVNEANCNAAHERDKKFAGWTLDSEYEIRNAIDVGADSYFTNDTALALELERKYRPVASEPAVASDHSTLLFASDYQAMSGFDDPSETLRKVTRAAVSDGKQIDMAVICGDYTNDATLHDYQLSGEDSIEEIRGVLAEEANLGESDDILFEQGNHDALTDSIASSGLHEYDNYLVYVLNTEYDFPWKQGKVSGCHEKVDKAAEDMKECFDKLTASEEARPVIIAGHVPLHYTARTSSKHTTGDNLYSSVIFDVVNRAAESLDIIYLYGHDHSKGWDCYMGGACVYKAPGDGLLLPVFHDDDVNSDQFEEKKLNFTYLNAGYVGYYINCAPVEYSSDPDSVYRAADETLTCTVCEIYPDRIEITRYDENGRHVLGAAGEGNPYKGGIDEDLIGSEHYSKESAGPAVIDRKKENVEMKDAA